MKKNLTKIFSLVISCLLSVCLLITFVFASIGINLTNKSLNKYLISSGYNQIVSQKILEKLHNFADINNLPHEIFDEFVNMEFATNNIYEYIISISNDSQDNKYISDISKKKKNLAEKVKNYSLSHMNLTLQQQENIDKITEDFVDNCAEIYKTSLKSNFLEKLFVYTKFISNYYACWLFALICLSLVVSTLLVYIQKWKHKGYRYIIYSLISTGLVFLSLIIYICSSNVINRISITNQELYMLITKILTGCLTSFCISLLIIIILIFLLSYIYKIRRKNA